jgi:uncharacterized protein (DUF2062 family)
VWLFALPCLGVFVILLGGAGGLFGWRRFAGLAAVPTLASTFVLGVWLVLREAPTPGDLMADMEIALWCLLQVLLIVAVIAGAALALLLRGAKRLFQRRTRQAG